MELFSNDVLLFQGRIRFHTRGKVTRETRIGHCQKELGVCVCAGIEIEHSEGKTGSENMTA